MDGSSLSPTFWRTCRVLANATRQRILETLLVRSPMDVGTVGGVCRLTEATACAHLRALQARGLLAVDRVGRHVFYRLHADPIVPHADDLLLALKASIRRRDSIPARIRDLTAFTHTRRIHLARALADGPRTARELRSQCHVSAPALFRHLDKLQRRLVVRSDSHGSWRLGRPDSAFARRLVAIALED